MRICWWKNHIAKSSRKGRSGKERRTPLRGGSCGALGGSGWRFGVYAEALLEVGTVSRGSAANTRRLSPHKSLRYSVFRSFRFSGPARTPATRPFVNALAKCRAPAKLFNRKLRIFLVLQSRQKGQLHHRGTLCLQGTKQEVRDRPHLVVIA